MAPSWASRVEDPELLMSCEPEESEFHGTGAAARPRGFPKKVAALVLGLGAVAGLVCLAGSHGQGGSVQAASFESTVSFWGMAKKKEDSDKKKDGDKKKDKKKDEEEPCTEDNVAYMPYMMKQPFAKLVLLPMECEAHCKNVTGCTHYTFYAAIPKGLCYLADNWGIRTPQLSLGSMVPPIAGRPCSVKEHAKKISKQVSTDAIEKLQADMSGNITKAYELCREEETAYTPFYLFFWKNSSASCRHACLKNNYCAKWTFLTLSNTCQLANNYSVATKGIVYTHSSTKVCEEAAQEQVAKTKQAEQEKKDNFDKIFRRKEYEKKKKAEEEEAKKKKEEEEAAAAKKSKRPSWFGKKLKESE
mmetsp:Transcript_87960/g.121298  ORF Transcript_87960/g.121298 Transcript_87960/m.121298 type:complete len:360 (-) Transcript_87960:123-1202(-)